MGPGRPRWCWPIAALAAIVLAAMGPASPTRAGAISVAGIAVPVAVRAMVGGAAPAAARIAAAAAVPTCAPNQDPLSGCSFSVVATPFGCGSSYNGYNANPTCTPAPTATPEPRMCIYGFGVVDPFGLSRDPGAILQSCGIDEHVALRLQSQALDELQAAHQLQPGASVDRQRLMSWERDAVRAVMFDHLLAAISSPARTADQQALVDGFARLLQARRVAAAQEAQRQYNFWDASKCTYQAPPGFSYTISEVCSNPFAGAFTTPPPPSLDEFRAYGTAHAYEDLQGAGFAFAAADTANSLGLVAGLSIAGVVGAGVAGGAIGASLTVGGAVIGAVFPYMAAGIAAQGAAIFGEGFATAADIAAVGAEAAGIIGFALGASVVAVVVAAILISVFQGINVFTAAAIPGDLQGDLNTAKNTVPDLRQEIKADAGIKEIYGVFIATTLPDYPAAPGADAVPAVQASDPQFAVTRSPSNYTSVSPSLTYVAGDAASHTARLSGGWFVDQQAITGAVSARMALHLNYIDWTGQGRSAWRIGDRFLETRIGSSGATAVLTDTLQYQTPDGQHWAARVARPSDLATVTALAGNVAAFQTAVANATARAVAPAATARAAAATATALARGGTPSFSFGCATTSGPQSFVVPAGVTSLNVLAEGAAGAVGHAPGRGASIRGTLAVTSGETLSIWVGCRGQRGEGGAGWARGGAADERGGDGGPGDRDGPGGAGRLQRAVRLRARAPDLHRPRGC
jgi:hypothetical protein